jgi:RluA family pseudouridine synthase
VTLTSSAKLNVVFETDDLIVLNKPEGVSSIPERGDKKDDLSHALSRYAGKRLSPVYLLDKSVSGLIVYAKTPEVHGFLSGQLEAGTFTQTFIALLHGVTKEKKGSVNVPLRKFGSGRMGVASAGYEGLDASTRYEVMERFTAHTLVRISPLTNRRHQIRAHMFSIGYPVVGDPLYGDPLLQKPFPHLLLHAHEIGFESAPGQRQNITTPMPGYFGDVKKKLVH